MQLLSLNQPNYQTEFLRLIADGIASGVVQQAPEAWGNAVQQALGVGVSLPLTASVSVVEEVVNLSLLGGAYQVGADGAWVTIPPTVAMAGTKAYLVISQKADRSLADTNPVTVLVTTSTLDAVVVTPAADPDPETAVSNVLLAEVVDGVLIQRRHGNFTLGLWQIDGDFVRWPATVAGTIPTPAP